MEYSVQFSSVQSLSLTLCDPMNHSTPGLPVTTHLPPTTNSWSPPKPMSIMSVMPSNYLILRYPLFLRPQSFKASGSFQMSQLFASDGQSIGVSASTSVLPMNTQD